MILFLNNTLANFAHHLLLFNSMIMRRNRTIIKLLTLYPVIKAFKP